MQMKLPCPTANWNNQWRCKPPVCTNTSPSKGRPISNALFPERPVVRHSHAVSDLSFQENATSLQKSFMPVHIVIAKALRGHPLIVDLHQRNIWKLELDSVKLLSLLMDFLKFRSTFTRQKEEEKDKVEEPGSHKMMLRRNEQKEEVHGKRWRGS